MAELDRAVLALSLQEVVDKIRWQLADHDCWPEHCDQNGPALREIAEKAYRLGVEAERTRILAITERVAAEVGPLSRHPKVQIAGDCGGDHAGACLISSEGEIAMAIRKTHKRGHGQAAIYITLPSGATLRWENTRDIPLVELAEHLRKTADSVEKCAAQEPPS